MFGRARSFLCTVLATPTLNQSPVRLLPALMEKHRFVCNIPDVSSLKVKHDAEAKEFQIDFPDCRAYLQYEKDGNVFKILHTQVPQEVGGRGVGKILAKAALSHVEENNYRAEIYCDYIQDYIQRFEPHYLKYVQRP